MSQTHAQSHALATYVLSLIDRHWFPSLYDEYDLTMARLLMTVYLRAAARDPISKKEAWERCGVRDFKTARKYIAEAHRRGLLTFRKDMQDRRRDLLVPTYQTIKAIEAEIEEWRRKLTSIVETQGT